jgi:CAAX protease family protein
MMISSVMRPALGARGGPVALSVLIVAVVLATVLSVAAGYEVDAAYAIASKVVLCALAVGLLWGLGCWGRSGFLELPIRRDLVWLAPPGLLVLGTLIAVIAAGPVPMEPSLVLAFGLVALATGFSEEGLFRGVLLDSMRPWGRTWAVVGTTAAFASIHLGGLLAGATLEATFAQVLIGGIPFGLAFAGLRLTTRSIWPLIVIHGINNFASYLMSGHWEAVTQDTSRFAVASILQLTLIVVLVAYGVWFLRRFHQRGAIAGHAGG